MLGPAIRFVKKKSVPRRGGRAATGNFPLRRKQKKQAQLGVPHSEKQVKLY